MRADDRPTETCVMRVMQANQRRSRGWALDYIDMLNGGNLICLDCGSENHTQGHDLCNYTKVETEA